MDKIPNVISSDTLSMHERADLAMHNDEYKAPCLCSSVRKSIAVAIDVEEGS